MLAKMDSSHTINVQYLQSLDYDREMAPASGKITVNGNEINAYAVNDQVGLQDQLVPVNESNATNGSKKLGRNESQKATDEGELTTESFVQREAKMRSFTQTYHTR